LVTDLAFCFTNFFACHYGSSIGSIGYSIGVADTCEHASNVVVIIYVSPISAKRVEAQRATIVLHENASHASVEPPTVCAVCVNLV
jgi:hypothetical protein